ncbi:MAG TPA: beta-propeller fold lactonase family protein, partial [Rhodocyclaceae bacterium]|nr:beta-propeller fold lactonase family protein [Rhodocyclaceae bacterium]
GTPWASDVHLTPDGRFLYAAERTSSTLAAFSVDAKTGLITKLGSFPTETQPRGFNIDPSGKYLLATGQKSDKISVHAIDQNNGGLTLLGRYPAGKNSNWVEIVSFD